MSTAYPIQDQEARTRPVVPVGTPLAFGRREHLLLGRAADESWWSARTDDPAYADQVLAGLQTVSGDSPALAIGALSFRPDAPALMTLVDRCAPRQLPARPGPVGPVQIEHRPSRSGYQQAVATAVDRLRDDPVAAKVVLGRWLELRTANRLDPLALLAGLAASAGPAYLFSIPAPTIDDSAEPAFLVGASPELLVSRRSRLVRATPMAGSTKRHPDPAVDRATAGRLLDSAKDAVEHRYVAADVADALRPWCTELVVDGPRLVRTDTMWHLATEIRGQLRGDRPGLSALHLAQLLHPTPAVCGTPTGWALDTIAELEGPRGAAAGAVGWVDATGDGTYAVAIRMGVLAGHRLRLFAGAGIVDASTPSAELAETDAKLATMLNGLGLTAAELEEVTR